MTQSQMPVAIGGIVYVARAWSYGEHRVPCPVCYGKLFAILELGNGERVTVECDGCGLGFDGPRGWVNEPCAGSAVDVTTVQGVHLVDGKWHILTDGRGLKWGVDVFATEAEAEVKRALMYDNEVKNATDRAMSIAAHKRKKVTWLVRYHRDALKKAQREAEYHSRKLSDALARQRLTKSEE